MQTGSTRPRFAACTQLAVWDFWRDFARTRGIFLRESLSKVIEVLTACASVSRDEIKGAS